jgi:hypothetical protein
MCIWLCWTTDDDDADDDMNKNEGGQPYGQRGGVGGGKVMAINGHGMRDENGGRGVLEWGTTKEMTTGHIAKYVVGRINVYSDSHRCVEFSMLELY